MTVTEPSEAPQAPEALTSVAPAVEQRLAEVLDAELARWSRFDAALVPPLTATRELVLAGGKRLRPAFCHWAFIGAGGRPDDPAIVDLGAAFELLHAFALMHDDVMDGSPTRRGRPAIHTAFAETHGDRGWRGEPRRFGEGVAILAGDLAAVFADRLVSNLVPEAATLWHELKIEINVGQYLDVVGTVQARTDLDTARRISRYKSGKYTVERPLQLGATLAPGGTRIAPALAAFGEPLGEAFQLRDDILGAFGDTALTGKPVGDDLREGKPTPLLALAVERATPQQASVLGRVGRDDLGVDEVAAIQSAIESSGARAQVEQRIEACTDAAIDALDAVRLEGAANDALTALARYVAAREH
jgi:geranylgeranyl diphosphate synthase type I